MLELSSTGKSYVIQDANYLLNYYSAVLQSPSNYVKKHDHLFSLFIIHTQKTEFI